MDVCIPFIRHLPGNARGTGTPSAPVLPRSRRRVSTTLSGKGATVLAPSCRGFTLIELILVLVIIGFLTSLVAPAITSTTGLRLKTAVRRLAAGLRFARSQAVITGTTYQVVFDVETGSVAIEPVEEGDPYAPYRYGERSGETPGDDTGEAQRARMRKQEQKRYTLPEGVTLAKVVLNGEEIAEGQAWIEFYPNGSCSGGEVLVMDTRERTYRIGLEFLTGVVTIREGEET